MSSSRPSFRPSAALIVAILALVISLGGNAYSVAKINGSAIAKGTIKGKALKNDTVTGKQINESTLGQVPSAATAAPTGAAGGDLAGTYPNPTIKPDSIGASDLGVITERSAVSSTITNGNSGTVAVQCNPGEQVISGGNDSTSANLNYVVASRREPPNGWRVYAQNNTGSTISITVRAYCLAP